MKRWFTIANIQAFLLGLPIVGFIFASAVYVAHGDIMYDADIARDFLLLQEILEKKVILIGARSGAAPGFFHGPLWSYLNFPAFFVGQGNPVAVGWFWVLLSVLFIISSFWFGKKYFGKTAGYLFTLFVSVQMIGLTRAFFNPVGALLCMPIFLGTLLLFIQTKKIKYLILHSLIGGLMFQFQVAVGTPLLLLSGVLLLLLALMRYIPLRRLLGFTAAGVPLLTYLLFDLRHHFSLFQAVVVYLSGHHSSAYPSFWAKFTDRLAAMATSGTFYLPEGFSAFAPWLFWGIIALTLYRLTKKDFLPAFFAYFYIGFYALSLIHGGGWGYYYYFPLFPVAYMLLIATLRKISKVGMIVLTLLLVILQFQTQLTTLRTDLSLIGKRQMSWQFHNTIAKVMFEEAKTTDFGFFLYSPDIQGYRSKYPVIYQQRLHPQKTVHLYEKLPETFVLLAGPPEYPLPWEPDPQGFLQHSLRLSRQPTQSWGFNQSYQLVTFNLDANAVTIPFDQDINNWLHFR